MFSFLQVIFYFTLIILLPDRIHCNIYKGLDTNLKTVDRNQLQEDSDVIQRKNDTNAVWDNHDYPIKARNLAKVYKNGVEAVSHNTFNVKKGEVFGLLGPNGAGKSSMFNMVTLDLRRNNGDVKIESKNIDELNVVQDGIKYGTCP